MGGKRVKLETHIKPSASSVSKTDNLETVNTTHAMQTIETQVIGLNY